MAPTVRGGKAGRVARFLIPLAPVRVAPEGSNVVMAPPASRTNPWPWPVPSV